MIRFRKFGKHWKGLDQIEQFRGTNYVVNYASSSSIIPSKFANPFVLTKSSIEYEKVGRFT